MNWTTSFSAETADIKTPLRRRSQRFPMDMPAILTPYDTPHDNGRVANGAAPPDAAQPHPYTAAHTRDISADGAFLCLPVAPPLGSRLHLQMFTSVQQRANGSTPPSFMMVEADAVVVRHAADGVAVTFATPPSIRRMTDLC